MPNLWHGDGEKHSRIFAAVIPNGSPNFPSAPFLFLSLRDFLPSLSVSMDTLTCPLHLEQRDAASSRVDSRATANRYPDISRGGISSTFVLFRKVLSTQLPSESRSWGACGSTQEESGVCRSVLDASCSLTGYRISIPPISHRGQPPQGSRVIVIDLAASPNHPIRRDRR